MLQTYFLGANTPLGFQSEYDSLQQDRRITKLWILKGGAGCGKSTLMRSVAAQAEELGLAVERIPCSSDPSSLDGVVVPEAGMGIVDGTAPHIVEPRLCGLNANYINLGAFCREEVLKPIAPAIRAAKAANAACYKPAYAALSAAAAIRRLLRELAGQTQLSAVMDPAHETLMGSLPAAEEKGPLLRCYLTAMTPEGLITCLPRVRTLWVLRDPFGLGGDLIMELAKRWQEAGKRGILAMDPMEPDQPSGFFLPEQDLGYWRADPLFDTPASALCIDLEGEVLNMLPREMSPAVSDLHRIRRQLSEECVFWLRQAKLRHDVLEELCRPAMDFSAVEEQAERLARSLLTEA